MFFVSSISSKKRTKNTSHKDCSIKVRSKHSAVLLLSLQQNLMEQTLVVKTNSFVRFLEEFTARQFAFEII